jgi:hypothetical protein
MAVNDFEMMESPLGAVWAGQRGNAGSAIWLLHRDAKVVPATPE